MANGGDINTSITNRQNINAGINETFLKGASAYEMAVQEGYVGTEEEWLASLHGTDGHTPEITSTKVGTREHKLYADGVEFASIFDGFDGADGKDGKDGKDGHSPEITATKSGKTVSFKVDDTEVATVSDGNDGAPGATGPSGADGHTPQITATKSGKVTTIKADGTAIAEINDGNDGPTGPQGPKGDPGALNFHICSQTEYDATTRVPTVQNPEDDTFYLVPSASVTSPDLFVEWIYVNNAWEMFGSATVDISGKADKVQNATNGNFASLDSNGNLADSGHKHSDYLTQHQDITGKADKVINATSGNFASLDSNGNLADSGHSFSEINQELTSVKSDLSELETELKSDISEIEDAVQSIYVVPTEVRRAIYTLLGNAVYTETGLTDEIAVVEAWAESVTELTVTPSSATINGNNTRQLTAITVPTVSAVTWSSSDNEVATVDNVGLVTGVGNGTAIIKAISGGVIARCTITVDGFATLTGISAVYTQGGIVEITDSLDSLKDNLVVTASYSDSTTVIVPKDAYTLSGTLSEGISTITAIYKTKSTTFTVNVSGQEELWINDLGSTASTVSFNLYPFVLPVDAYEYDYSKVISAIEANFNKSGVVSIGYYQDGSPSGRSEDDSKLTIHETLTVSASGVQKLTLNTPMQIPSGYSMCIGFSTDTATFKYGGSRTKGFFYRKSSDHIWNTLNLKLGVNVYRRRLYV